MYSLFVSMPLNSFIALSGQFGMTTRKLACGVPFFSFSTKRRINTVSQINDGTAFASARKQIRSHIFGQVIAETIKLQCIVIAVVIENK